LDSTIKCLSLPKTLLQQKQSDRKQQQRIRTLASSNKRCLVQTAASSYFFCSKARVRQARFGLLGPSSLSCVSCDSIDSDESSLCSFSGVNSKAPRSPPYNVPLAYVNTLQASKMKQVLPKVISEEPHRHHSQKKIDSPAA